MTAWSLEVPVHETDLFASSFVADPYPALENIRALGRLSYHAPHRQYGLTGWRDCARVLGSAETYMTDPALFLSLFGDHTMETMEPWPAPRGTQHLGSQLPTRRRAAVEHTCPGGRRCPVAALR